MSRAVLRSGPGLGAFFVALCVAFGGALALLGCDAEPRPTVAPEQPVVVVVGSKKFPESVILAELFAQTYEAAGGTVERRANMGNTAILMAALKSGSIDLYPEYTGTALNAVRNRPAESTSESVRRAVEHGLAAEYGLTWGPPLGFNNTYALGVRGPLARAEGLRTIGDLAAAQARGVTIRFALTHEFLSRDDGWPNLSAAYGLTGTPKGAEHGLAYELLDQERADVIDVYATEGLIGAHDLVVLEDDRRFFPPYDAAFVWGGKLAGDPRALAAIMRLAGSLDDRTIRNLNHAVEVLGQSPAEVVRDYRGNLAKYEQAETRTLTQISVSRKALGFFALVSEDREALLGQLATHVLLTLTAVLFAVLIAVPLGVLATKRRAFATLAIGGSGVMQTIPSLALLVFMIPVVGSLIGGLAAPQSWLGRHAMECTALVALFLYALLPIVRNTKEGLESVDRAVLDAAKGMGMTRVQRFRLVTFPLAFPVILAGIRTALVITVGTAILAAFIGAGGLGAPIMKGLSVQNYTEVLTGAIPAALLALVLDGGFALVQRTVTPKL